MIPIQEYLTNNKIKEKLLSTSPDSQRDKLTREFNAINERCIKGEIVGVSYNYINKHFSVKGKLNKSMAIGHLCNLLNLNANDIVKGKTCLYINKQVSK